MNVFAHGGNSSISRTRIIAAPGEKGSWEGSERIQSWRHMEGTVSVPRRSPQQFFGDYNPYTEVLAETGSPPHR